MLIGAHVSISGGLANAVERGVERGCRSIQIFNQSPRMWRPNAYTDDDFVAFREAMAASPIDAVVIHALYLINCASDDEQLWAKSVASLTHALQVGDAIGAAGVVLHPGSSKGEPYDEAVGRIADAIRAALAESERCPLLLENAAGEKAIGNRFEQLADMIAAVDGHPRVGACVDSCHSLAAGYDVRTADLLTEVVDRFDAIVGLDRLRCVHMNDSKMPLGSFRDRHENLGDGELGPAGCAAFLSEPRFEELPVVLETPGAEGKGADRGDIEHALRLRAEGLDARGGGDHL